MGVVLAKLGKYDEAMTSLSEALSIREAIDEKTYRHTTLQEMGMIAYGQKKIDTCIKCFDDAFDLWNTESSIEMWLDTLLTVAVDKDAIADLVRPADLQAADVL